MDFFEERGAHVVAHTNTADYSALSRHPHAFERIAHKARALIKDGLPGIPGVVERTDWVTFVLAEDMVVTQRRPKVRLRSGVRSVVTPRCKIAWAWLAFPVRLGKRSQPDVRQRVLHHLLQHRERQRDDVRTTLGRANDVQRRAEAGREDIALDALHPEYLSQVADDRHAIV